MHLLGQLSKFQSIQIAFTYDTTENDNSYPFTAHYYAIHYQLH